MTNLRLACFSPLPPDKSGIATYSARLFEALRDKAELILFHDAPETVADAIHNRFTIRALEDFKGPLAENVDFCWYHMGSNLQFHRAIYDTLLRYPGIVTLHDVNLHPFLGEHYMKRSFGLYSREMGFAYGLDGLEHARQAHHEGQSYQVQAYPLFQRLLHSQLGVVVHNSFAKELLQTVPSQTPILQLPLQQEDLLPQLPAPVEAKQQLGFKATDIVLGSFGYLAPQKRLEVVLTAVSHLLPHFPNLHYLLVGQKVADYELTIPPELEGHVHFLGFVDDAQFNNALSATDIGINLRYPTIGETSATLLSLFGAGTATIVTNAGSFTELPDDTCLKISHEEDELAELTATIQMLAGSADKRQAIGTAANQYIREVCHPDVVADRFLAFVQERIK